jgi:hypothetical protein
VVWGQTGLDPMDYEIQRSTKHCAVSGREFAPGETYYSVLMAEGDDVQRADYAEEAWKGPPEGALGWWKSKIPDAKSKRKHWAPNDVMLQVFDELAAQESKQDMRYVLALLLVRRRVMRHEDTERDEQGQEQMVLYCPRRDETYRIPAVLPDAPRVDEIQAELAKLLE